MEGNIRENIAEHLFPFSLYASGNFNHADIINAMCQMAEVFEAVYTQGVIKQFDLKPIKHEEATT